LLLLSRDTLSFLEVEDGVLFGLVLRLEKMLVIFLELS